MECRNCITLFWNKCFEAMKIFVFNKERLKCSRKNESKKKVANGNALHNIWKNITRCWAHFFYFGIPFVLWPTISWISYFVDCIAIRMCFQHSIAILSPVVYQFNQIIYTIYTLDLTVLRNTLKFFGSRW